jgi:phosphoglycerate dehydrogenase-like enzyme
MMPLRVVVYHPNAAEYGRLLQEHHPELEVRDTSDADILSHRIREADALLAWRVPLAALAEATRLRWIQLTGAGVDHLIPARGLLGRIVVTNARGIHADVMADYTLAVILMLQWKFPSLLKDQQARIWGYQSTAPLAGKTLGVVGLGSIGREIARRAPVFGLNVVGVRRHPTPTDGVTRVFEANELATMLPLCDVVVLVVPATPESARMIGEPELKLMKPTAHLINIGRGSLIDEPALIRALRERWIAGAGLDVFEQEPLPPDSPLWSLDNVIITPHISGEPEGYPGRVIDIFSANLDRLRTGQVLKNQVDFTRGY